MTENKYIRIIEDIKEIRKLPKNSEELFEGMNTVEINLFRDVYVREIGFVLLTEENIKTIGEALINEGMNKVVSIGAGTGILEQWLMKYFPQLEIKATDPYTTAEENMYFNGKFYTKEKLFHKGAINKYKDWMDGVLLSWAPYRNEMDYEVWKELPSGKKIAVIGEGYGGCVGSDRFWDAVEEESIVIDDYTPIETFPFIHDYLSMYQKP